MIEGKLADVSGHKMYYEIAGENTPVVILDTGIGEDSSTWESIRPAIAGFTTAFSYDRAGLGKSESGPDPRDSQQMVDELRAVLNQARLSPPYVLVGQSFGGLNMQLFAQQHPNETGALVLLDPTFPDLINRVEATQKPDVIGIFKAQFAEVLESVTEELFRASCQLVADMGKLPDVPITVITSVLPMPLPPGFQELRLEIMDIMKKGHSDLASAYPKGQHILAEQSSLVVHHEQPELVIAAIRKVVEELRSQIF